MNRIVYLLPQGWERQSSGVYTFVRVVLREWEKRHECKVAEYPLLRTDQNAPVRRAEGSCAVELIPSFTRLACGYGGELISELRRLWALRGELRGRLIVLNDFGCELRPIALRILFPFHRIIAISHTHPNLAKKDVWVRRLVEKLCYWSCSRVVFNSNALKYMWEQKLGRPIRRGAVVHHGMALPDSFEVPAEYPSKPSPDTIDFVCVGLFYNWKGQLALIEAWLEAMAACSVPLHLVLVGNGACLEDARARVRELKLEPHVVFSGFQKNGADFFNGGDIAIHYPVEPEAFGLVLLEAMGRGKPIIAPAHGGATEIVVDGVTGILVEPGGGGGEKLKAESRKLKLRQYGGNTEDGGPRTTNEERSTKDQGPSTKNQEHVSLVEAVCRLAEDENLRKRMGEAGRERVKTEFSVEKMLAGYDRVFRELAG